MKISIIQADITTIAADAIVNAANTSLLGGGGVDGAIHKKGGPEILEACMKIRAKQGRCYIGEAVITTAGNLPAKFVIHTVGPVWNGDKEEKVQLLKDCYTNSLKLATAYNFRTIAFPNISTGIYHFPKEKAVKIAFEAIEEYFKNEKNTTIQEVMFVCFDEENFGLYNNYEQTKK